MEMWITRQVWKNPFSATLPTWRIRNNIHPCYQSVGVQDKKLFWSGHQLILSIQHWSICNLIMSGINSVWQRCLITLNNFPICCVNILIRWPPGAGGHCRYYCDICNNSGRQIGCYPSLATQIWPGRHNILRVFGPIGAIIPQPYCIL